MAGPQLRVPNNSPVNLLSRRLSVWRAVFLLKSVAGPKQQCRNQFRIWCAVIRIRNSPSRLFEANTSLCKFTFFEKSGMVPEKCKILVSTLWSLDIRVFHRCAPENLLKPASKCASSGFLLKSISWPSEKFRGYKSWCAVIRIMEPTCQLVFIQIQVFQSNILRKVWDGS